MEMSTARRPSVDPLNPSVSTKLARPAGRYFTLRLRGLLRPGRVDEVGAPFSCVRFLGTLDFGALSCVARRRSQRGELLYQTGDVTQRCVIVRVPTPPSAETLLARMRLRATQVAHS